MSYHILSTDRLELRVTSLKDLDHLIALRTNEAVMTYIGIFRKRKTGRITQSLEEIQDHLMQAYPYYQEFGLGFFCVFEKHTGNFIGQAGLFHLAFNINQPDIELAYRFLPEYWGQGYATECAKALIQWGFETLKLPKIIALAHPDNLNSIRVLEKAGLNFIGNQKFQGHRLPFYEITRTIATSTEIIQHNATQYNAIASLWQQKRNWHIEKPSIDKLTALLKPGSSILDIGCGNGKPIMAQLSEQGFNITGIDISSALIDFAKQNLPHHQFYYGDFLTTDIHESFDAIVCWCMLFHCHQSQHLIALHKMWQHLNHHGLLLITFADTSITVPPPAQQVDEHTIISNQFGHRFYYSGQPAAINHHRVQKAGFKILDDYHDQPGNQVILAQKIDK